MKIIAWLCHEPYEPGFMFAAPVPAHDFITRDPKVGKMYKGRALVFLDEVQQQPSSSTVLDCKGDDMEGTG